VYGSLPPMFSWIFAGWYDKCLTNLPHCPGGIQKTVDMVVLPVVY
jgi:hypothetical protein